MSQNKVEHLIFDPP